MRWFSIVSLRPAKDVTRFLAMKFSRMLEFSYEREREREGVDRERGKHIPSSSSSFSPWSSPGIRASPGFSLIIAAFACRRQ